MVRNLQPWVFAVVEGAARLADYSERAKSYLLATLDKKSPLAQHRDMLIEPAFNIFYGAPCLVVICARPPIQQSMEDCCLSAHERGFGTCWIGFARPWLDLEETRAELDIPADCHPVAPIIIGNPASTPDPTERRAPIVIWTVDGVRP